jgi:hypothetical protein
MNSDREASDHTSRKRVKMRKAINMHIYGGRIPPNCRVFQERERVENRAYVVSMIPGKVSMTHTSLDPSILSKQPHFPPENHSPTLSLLKSIGAIGAKDLPSFDNIGTVNLQLRLD